MEDALEERQVVVFSLDDLWLEEGKCHLVARAVNNTIYTLTRAICEDHTITIQLANIGLDHDATMGDAHQDVGAHCWMSLPDLVIGFGQAIVAHLTDLQLDKSPVQSELPGVRHNAWCAQLIEWPTHNIFGNNMKTTSYRQVCHSRDSRGFRRDIHRRIADAQDQHMLIDILVGLHVSVAMDDRANEVAWKSRV